MEATIAAEEDQRRRLALMVLSSVVWSLWGYEILIAIGSQIAGFHESVNAASEAFWLPWWDMDHPLSGIYMAVMLAAGIAALVAYLRIAGVTRAALPIGSLGLPILGAVLAALLIDVFAWQVIVNLTTSLDAGEALLNEREDYTYTLTPAHLPGEFMWSVVMAPIFEELVFRGLLLGCLLARGWNPWLAVAVTSAAFAGIHSQYYLPGLTSVFIGGLLFGWLRIMSNGLAAPILAHSAMNGWVFFEDWSGIAQT